MAKGLRTKNFAKAEPRKGASVEGYARRHLSELDSDGIEALTKRYPAVIKALGNLADNEQSALLLAAATPYTLDSMIEAAANYEAQGSAATLSNRDKVLVESIRAEDGDAIADKFSERLLAAKKLSKGKMRVSG